MTARVMQISWENRTPRTLLMFVAHRTDPTSRGQTFTPPRVPAPPSATYLQYEYSVSTAYYSATNIEPSSTFEFQVAYEDSGPYRDSWHVAVMDPESLNVYMLDGNTLVPSAAMNIAPSTSVTAWIEMTPPANPVVFMRPNAFTPPRSGPPSLYTGLPMTASQESLVQFPPFPNMRKSVTALDKNDRGFYVSAVKRLKQLPSRLDPATNSRYDDYVFTHMLSMYLLKVTDSTKPVQNGNLTEGAMRTNMWAHNGPVFTAWHREFLHQFETDLAFALLDVGWSAWEGYGFGIPYWDWTVTGRAVGSSPWLDDFMGGDGSVTPLTGPFGTSFVWPITLTDGGGPAGPSALTRGKWLPSSTLPTADDVTKTLAQALYDIAPWDNSKTLSSFRNDLEGWHSTADPARLPAMHNLVHDWVGGSMESVGSAPNDPTFFLHHSNVDRLWASWQRQNPVAHTYLPSAPTTNHNGAVPSLNDAMKFTEPPFSAPWTDAPATPAGVSSYHALNYLYDDLDAVHPAAVDLAVHPGAVELAVHPGAVELAPRPAAVDDAAHPGGAVDLAAGSGAAETPYRRAGRE